MTSQELNAIMMRLGLRKVEITPPIYALASEINRQDKELERYKPKDIPAQLGQKPLTTDEMTVTEQPKTNSL